jgi:hypothetical protein
MLRRVDGMRPGGAGGRDVDAGRGHGHISADRGIQSAGREACYQSGGGACAQPVGSRCRGRCAEPVRRGQPRCESRASPRGRCSGARW